MGRATFYRNFKDKDDVLLCHLKHLAVEWQSKFEPGSDPSPCELLAVVLHGMEAERLFFLALRREKKLDLIERALSGFLEQSIDRPLQETYAIVSCSWLRYGWMRTWLERGMKDDIDELSALLPDSPAL